MENFSSKAYMILSIAYMILCTIVILYDRKEMIIGIIHSIQVEIKKGGEKIKNRTYYIVFVVILISSIFLYTFSHEKPSGIPFNKIEEIYSHNSVFVFYEGLDKSDRIYIIDMYWGWGRANLERPIYSFKYSDSKKNSNNLICLISKEDTMFDDLINELGIEEKYEEQVLRRSNISSLAMLVRSDNINYLIFSENKQRGLGAAILYLSNPATWEFHDEESVLCFQWEDYDGDNKITINEINVKPRKNQFSGYKPQKKEEINNQLFEEFKKDTAIVLGPNLNTFDLLSAGNIVWSLSYYFRDADKPRILCDYEEIEATNIIIIGGTDSNCYAKIICSTLDLTPAYDREDGTFKIQIEDQNLDLSEEKGDVDELCIIAFKRIGDKNMVWVAGLEENGTYIGSVFLSLEKNWENLYEQKTILILGWTDSNYNKSVELNEISIISQIGSENTK